MTVPESKARTQHGKQLPRGQRIGKTLREEETNWPTLQTAFLTVTEHLTRAGPLVGCLPTAASGRAIGRKRVLGKLHTNRAPARTAALGKSLSGFKSFGAATSFAKAEDDGEQSVPSLLRLLWQWQSLRRDESRASHSAGGILEVQFLMPHGPLSQGCHTSVTSVAAPANDPQRQSHYVTHTHLKSRAQAILLPQAPQQRDYSGTTTTLGTCCHENQLRPTWQERPVGAASSERQATRGLGAPSRGRLRRKDEPGPFVSPGRICWAGEQDAGENVAATRPRMRRKRNRLSHNPRRLFQEADFRAGPPAPGDSSKPGSRAAARPRQLPRHGHLQGCRPPSCPRHAPSSEQDTDATEASPMPQPRSGTHTGCSVAGRTESHLLRQ
ncbi:uncharacterized protein LOC123632029 [Lemur catta]|uniref:uncharacterized protein LOC123632029 n=1 Tax=Lemur catta TaxID=9447 RepID=UPI001E2695BD|nr:uncharacterized protein LOC123632029 [Lemur catta]